MDLAALEARLGSEDLLMLSGVSNGTECLLCNYGVQQGLRRLMLIVYSVITPNVEGVAT